MNDFFLGGHTLDLFIPQGNIQLQHKVHDFDMYTEPATWDDFENKRRNYKIRTCVAIFAALKPYLPLKLQRWSSKLLWNANREHFTTAQHDELEMHSDEAERRCEVAIIMTHMIHIDCQMMVENCLIMLLEVCMIYWDEICWTMNRDSRCSIYVATCAMSILCDKNIGWIIVRDIFGQNSS